MEPGFSLLAGQTWPTRTPLRMATPEKVPPLPSGPLSISPLLQPQTLRSQDPSHLSSPTHPSHFPVACFKACEGSFCLVGCSFVCLFVCFLGPHLQHVKVPRPEVKSEPQPLVYTTATAIPDPSHMCNLHHSSRQRQILNPRIKARDQTCVLRFLTH